MGGLVKKLLLKEVSLDESRISESSGSGHKALLTFQGAEQRLWNLVNLEPGSRAAPKPPAGVPVLGLVLTNKYLENFHQKHYQPGNVSIVVSGGMVREHVLSKVAQIYQESSGNQVAEASSAAPVQDPGFVYEHRREALGPVQCLFGYRIPGRAHPDMAVLDLIEAALVGPRGLLAYHLVQKGLVTFQETKRLPSAQGGIFSILLFPDGKKIDAAEVQLLALLESISRDGLGIHDLSRAKAKVVRQYFSRLRSHEERTRILYQQAEATDWWDLTRWPRLVSKLADREVKSVVKRYLRRSQLSLIEVFPKQGPPRKFTSESLGETFDLLFPTTIDEIRRDQELRWDSDPGDFTVPQIAQGKQQSRLKRTSVLRGPEIFLQAEHSSPLIDIGFFFPGGRVQETESNQGITELMLRALIADTSESSNWSAWKAMEKKGMEIQLLNELDFFGLRAQLLSRDLQNGLADFMTWLRAARISSSRVKSSLKVMSVLQKMEQKDPFSVGRLAIRKEVFPNHGYGLSRYGSKHSLLNLDSKAVEKWYGELLQNVHPLIVIYGDVEGTSFLPDLIPMLSNSRYRYRSKESHPFPAEGERSHLLQIGENWIVGGMSGPAQGTRADWVLDVLSNLLRLRRLRDDRNGEKRFPSHIKLGHQALFETGILYFGLPNPATERNRLDLFRQLARLSETQVTEQDLRKSIVLTITQYYRDPGRGSDYLLEVARYLLAGEKPGYQEEYQTTIKSLEVEDLRSSAVRFLGPLAHFELPVDNPDKK